MLPDCVFNAFPFRNPQKAKQSWVKLIICCKVRGFSKSELDEHIKEAFKKYNRRSSIKNWELDLSLLVNNNIKINDFEV